MKATVTNWHSNHASRNRAKRVEGKLWTAATKSHFDGALTLRFCAEDGRKLILEMSAFEAGKFAAEIQQRAEHLSSVPGVTS